MNETRPIAYFCAEYALDDNLHIYAGGLGVLAGDYVREAGDQGLSLVAMGLYYGEGFIHKELTNEGQVVDLHETKSPEQVGLEAVKNEKNEWIEVKVPIGGRIVKVRAWLWSYKSVKVYLLDTKVEGNNEQDTHITDALYTVDKETRFKQEMVLGIGGL